MGKNREKNINFYRSSEELSSQERLPSVSTSLEQTNTDYPSDTDYEADRAEHCNSNDDAINSNDKNQLDMESVIHETSSPSPIIPQNNSSEIDNNKRSHAKRLIERYFYQLSTGCGNVHCTNKNCASNEQFEALTPNQAAARAIKLFSEDGNLCDFFSSETAHCISNETKSYLEPVVLNSQSPKYDGSYR